MDNKFGRVLDRRFVGERDYWSTEIEVELQGTIMSPRNLFEVAMRIMGAVYFFSNAVGVLSFATMWLTEGQEIVSDPTFFYAYHSQSIWHVIGGVFGIVLFSYARSFSCWVYPDKEENLPHPIEANSETRFGPGDVYHTALVVLGLFLLVQLTEPLCKIIEEVLTGNMFAGNNYYMFGGSTAGFATKAIVYAVVGSLLIFGAGNISRKLAGQRYDTNSIPKPQFGIAMMLVLFVLFAMLMAVIRLLVVN
jgi:hypothetical protein